MLVVRSRDGGNAFMWTALPLETTAMIAPAGVGRGVLACGATFLELLDCREDSPSNDHTLAPALVAAAGYIEPSVKPAHEPTHEPNATHITYTIALVSDYRRGGVTRSDGKPALQGGVDVRLPDHWDFGVRGSSLAKHGNIELVLYGAKSFEVGETTLSIGGSYLTYPRDPSANSVSLQASASRSIGPVDATLSAIYVPPQDSLNHKDNVYVVARARTPIGTLMGIPVTLAASLGRMHGYFADSHSRSDWSVSLAGRVSGLDIGVSYIDNDLGDSRGDPAAVFSITNSF